MRTLVEAGMLDWPYLGVVLAAVLVGLLLREARRTPRPWTDPGWLLGWIWPMYLLHQFEEHGIDLLGHRYAFVGFLCELLGRPEPSGCPATPAFVFSVNVLACQFAFGLAFVVRGSRPVVAACVWGLPLVNLLAHILSAVDSGRYNPGLFTAVALFLPACIWMFRTIVSSGVVPVASVWRIVATGVLTHAVLLGSLQLRGRGLISGEALFLLNAVNGGWALVLGRVPPRSALAGDPA